MISLRVAFATLLFLVLTPCFALASSAGITDATGQNVLGYSSVPNVANRIQVDAVASGSEPAIRADCADANCALFIYAKGGSGIHLDMSKGNYPTAIGATTGHAATLFAEGGDANIALALLGKGLGLNLDGGGTDAGGAAGTGHSNYLRALGADPGSQPALSAMGGDGSISLRLNGKGGAGVDLDQAATGDYLTVTGGLTPTIRANGGDANLPVVLAPKGSSTLGLNQSATGTPVQTATPAVWIPMTYNGVRTYLAGYR